TLFHEASSRGMPVMRPAFFADIKDPELRAEESVFLLGADMLIKPKWAVSNHLPKGIWRSYLFENEKPEITQNQPDIFIRGGAVIPLTSRVIQHTGEYKSDSLTLLISFDEQGRAKGKIYSDEGDGFGYQKGFFEQSFFHATELSSGIIKLQVQQYGGQRLRRKRWIRIAVISDAGVRYSQWEKKSITFANWEAKLL